MADITPTTSMIEGMRRQNLQWSMILGELVDNAFDAGANRVSITFTGNQLEVADDGAGCKNLLLFVTPGARESKPTTQLGRYGIGAKDAAISAADSITVVSIHRGVKRHVHCDWKKLERSGRWEIDDPVAAEVADAPGTRIILQPLRSDRLKRPQELIDRLSLHYTPAIRQGRQIILKPSSNSQATPVPEYKFPPLEHERSVVLTVGAREASVRMGLVPEGQVVQESGLVISQGYRVILKGQRLGLGEQPTPGLFGWVELGRGWELTKNKDNVSTNLDALGDAIAESFKDIIERAAKRSQSIQFKNVAKEINQVLKDLTHGDEGRKAKRHTGAKAGLVEPKATGRKHRRAARVQVGDTFIEPMGRSRGLSISFEHMGQDGPACKVTGNIILLNVDIPALKADMNDEPALARHAIYAAASYFAQDRGQFQFMREYEDEFERMAHIAGHLLSKLNQRSVSLANVS